MKLFHDINKSIIKTFIDISLAYDLANNTHKQFNIITLANYTNYKHAYLVDLFEFNKNSLYGFKLRIKMSYDQYKQKPIKIAFCISGQLRGYEKAYNMWKKTKLFRNYNVTTIVSTWDEIGRKMPLPTCEHRVFQEPILTVYKEHCRKIGYENIKNMFPNLFKFLEEDNKIFIEDLERVYATKNITVENADKSNFNNFTNQMKMFYKIKSCYEKAMSISNDFSIVIRIRPDKAPFNDNLINWDKVFETALSKNIIYTDVTPFIHPNGGYGVGDQFALGSTDSMAIYCNSFNDININHKINEEIIEAYHPHTSLMYNLMINNIHIEGIKLLKFFSLIDAEKPSANKIKELLLTDISKSNRKKNEIDIKFLEKLERIV